MVIFEKFDFIGAAVAKFRGNPDLQPVDPFNDAKIETMCEIFGMSQDEVAADVLPTGAQVFAYRSMRAFENYHRDMEVKRAEKRLGELGVFSEKKKSRKPNPKRRKSAL